MFYFCSQRLNFARRKYLGSYLPSDTVLTAPSVNSAGAFFCLQLGLGNQFSPSTGPSTISTIVMPSDVAFPRNSFNSAMYRK